ncbi:MAG: hypothetical protein H6825_14880 [Planctomycetes bacterium]|nr:hypothetical protein [Planctomycetota bacterium]
MLALALGVWTARGPLALAFWDVRPLVEAGRRNALVDVVLDAYAFEGRPSAEMTARLGEPDDRWNCARDAVWRLGPYGSCAPTSTSGASSSKCASSPATMATSTRVPPSCRARSGRADAW